MKIKTKKRLIGLGSIFVSVFAGQFRLDIDNDYLYFLYTVSIITLFVWGFFTILFNELEG